MTIQQFCQSFKRGSCFIAGSICPKLIDEAYARMMGLSEAFMADTGLFHDPVDAVHLDAIFDLPPDTILGFDTSTALQELDEFLIIASC